MGYGTAQRIAFAGLVIGFLLAATGACSPFWQHAEVDVNSLAKFFSISIPIFGSTKLASIDIGLWWYCREYFDDKKCDFYEVNDDSDSSAYNSASAAFEPVSARTERTAKIWTCRIASIVCVFLSLSCALAGLCRTCCCPGGKTIAHGVIAFFAGGAGIVTIAVFVSSQSDNEGLLKIETDYAWGFYIFIAGAAVITVVSFLLCFAAPDNPIGQVFPASAGGGTIIVANSTQQTQSFGGPQYAYPNTMYAGPPNSTNAGQHPQMNAGQHPQMNAGQYPEKAYQPPPNQPFYTQPGTPDTHKDGMQTPHAWT